jgi:glycosyltransferase involved in cell wall biosynthesis
MPDQGRPTEALPLVSIMIPTYGQAELVGMAIESALAQDCPDLEVLVLDDASPDATPDVVRHFDDPRLIYVRNERNLGRVANYRNGLYNVARGKWVVNLDGDDYYTDRRFISRALDLLEADPEAVMATARCIAKSDRHQWMSASPPLRVMDGVDVLRRLPHPDVHLMHMATLYRRSLALDLDFYRDDSLSSDWESLYRLAARGRLHFLPDVVGVWRIHAGNASSSSTWTGLAGNLLIWRSIFGDPIVRKRLTASNADRLMARCVAHFGADGLRALVRAKDWSAACRYVHRVGSLSTTSVALMFLNIVNNFVGPRLQGSVRPERLG